MYRERWFSVAVNSLWDADGTWQRERVSPPLCRIARHYAATLSSLGRATRVASFGPGPRSPWPIDGRARDLDPKPETRHRVFTDISKTILRYLDPCVPSFGSRETDRVDLGTRFHALAPRPVKNGENKADKGSINGEMGICEWRDYGIIENWIFFFFFRNFGRSIIFL